MFRISAQWVPKFKKCTNIFDINLDAYYFISVKDEMYDKALNLYFIPLVISAATQMILATEKVMTATSKII